MFDKYKSNTTRIPLSVEINAHVFKNDLSRKMKDLRLIPTVRQISRSYKHKSHYLTVDFSCEYSYTLHLLDEVVAMGRKGSGEMKNYVVNSASTYAQ